MGNLSSLFIGIASPYLDMPASMVFRALINVESRVDNLFDLYKPTVNANGELEYEPSAINEVFLASSAVSYRAFSGNADAREFPETPMIKAGNVETAYIMVEGRLCQDTVFLIRLEAQRLLAQISFNFDKAERMMKGLSYNAGLSEAHFYIGPETLDELLHPAP